MAGKSQASDVGAIAKAVDVAVKNDASTSHFLRLPGEIRNMIYAYVLKDKYCIKALYRPKAAKSLFSNSRKYRIALLKVCREIYTETRLLPFSTNKWYFRSFVGIEVLCSRLTEQQRNAICKVHLYLDHTIQRIVPDTIDRMISHGVKSLPSLLPGLRLAEASVLWYRIRGYCYKTEKDKYREDLTAWMHGDRKLEGVVIMDPIRPKSQGLTGIHVTHWAYD